VPLAQARAEAVITLTAERGFVQWWAPGTMLQGWACALQGHGEEGTAQSRQGLDAWQATGAAQGWSYFLGLLTDAYTRTAHEGEGLAVLAEALAFVDKTGERHYEAELHRLKGELLLTQAPVDARQAEACFQQVLVLACRQQARSWELRAATSLARLWQQQGKRAEARALLAEVYGWFTEGFNTADLQEAKALLEELA
jgi:predicted ATPase